MQQIQMEQQQSQTVMQLIRMVKSLKHMLNYMQKSFIQELMFLKMKMLTGIQHLWM